MSAERSNPPDLLRFYELLNDIEMKLRQPVCDARCYDFMLDCLNCIEHRLPPVGLDALAAARRSHAGARAWLELDTHRTRCWRSVDELADNPGRAVQVDALRAVIFVLHAPGSEDLFDTLDLFVQFANRAGLHYAELERIFRRHFGECLPAPER